MIAGDCRRGREYGCDGGAQGQGPTKGNVDPTSGKRQRARSNSNKQCAEDARAIAKCQSPDTECDEKRQSVHRERKDGPAKQTDTRTSPMASMVVAPCAWIYQSRLPPPHGAVLRCKNETRRSCGVQLHLGVFEATALMRRRTSRRECRAASPCRRDCPEFPCPGNA